MNAVNHTASFGRNDKSLMYTRVLVQSRHPALRIHGLMEEMRAQHLA